MMAESGSAALLREYLDSVGFHQIYKFIVSNGAYTAVPSVVGASTARYVEFFFDTVLRDQSNLRLLQCLLFGRAAQFSELSDIEKPGAAALIEDGWLAVSGGTVAPGRFQLISAFGNDLLIDRRIHFGGGIHEVYIGPDSYFMLYYLDPRKIEREYHAVDLCTGSGVAALYLSLFCDHVLATDIGKMPLAVVRFNRSLNGKDDRVEVREQDLRETLDGGQTFDVLTCNPPFVAFPPGLPGTLYAHGADEDGLGYVRVIMERLPAILNTNGCAFLVADLTGDREGPYFLRELHLFAKAHSFEVDVYIDNVVSADTQIPALTGYVANLNPGRDAAAVAVEVEQFIRGTLRAEQYYMSTMCFRSAGRRGVRVLRRDRIPHEGMQRDKWPDVLLRT